MEQLLSDTSKMQPPPLPGHHCSIPAEITCIDMCTFEPFEIRPTTSMYRTDHCGPNGVIIIEVSLYRTAHCGPNGVLIIEVSLCRTIYCGPNGVLIIKVLLYQLTTE